MRKSIISGAAILAIAVASTPVAAIGLGDLAKVVLNGGSILKKGQQKCGSSLGLTTRDQLSLTFARAAAERSLPISEFLSLDQAGNAAADQAAQSTTFCDDTKKQKKGLLAKIAKAAKGMATAKAGL